MGEGLNSWIAAAVKREISGQIGEIRGHLGESSTGGVPECAVLADQKTTSGFEEVPAFHVEHSVNHGNVRTTDLACCLLGHTSPQAQCSQPSLDLTECVLLPLIGGALSEQFGSLNEPPHAGRAEVIYVTKFFRDSEVAVLGS